MCKGMCVDMCIGMCVDMCIGMYVDMCIGMCVDMCTGKLMDIQFDKAGHMIGARTINYLLEKSRIVTQAPITKMLH